MGCHTWAYLRLPLTTDQLRQLAEQEVEYRKIQWSRLADVWGEAERVAAGDQTTIGHLASDRYDRDNNTHTHYSEQTQVLYEEVNSHFSNKTGLSEHELYKLSASERERVGGYMCHDVFRVNDYPEVELHSEQEVLDFIALYQRDGKYVDLWPAGPGEKSSFDLINEFWTRFPDGMMTIR